MKSSTLITILSTFLLVGCSKQQSTLDKQLDEVEKIIEVSGEVAGPKKLKCFGASYLYPIFIEMGLIKSG